MAYRQHEVLSFLLETIVLRVRECFEDDSTVEVVFDEQPDAETSCVRVLYAGFQEKKINNMMNRIQVVRKLEGPDGPDFECLVKPPLMYQLTAAAVMENMKPSTALLAVGNLIGYLREHNEIDIGEYDWAGNEGSPVFIETLPLDNDWAYKLNIVYKGAFPVGVLLHTSAGLESTAIEKFTRVQERRFAAKEK